LVIRKYPADLLNADELGPIIFSESGEGLQHCINKRHGYCKQWHLDINLDKTKIIIMETGSYAVNKIFMYNNREILTTNTYIDA
jgi:hypothetical protein